MNRQQSTNQALQSTRWFLDVDNGPGDKLYPAVGRGPTGATGPGHVPLLARAVSGPAVNGHSGVSFL